jgi:hypothetical protein
MNAPFEGSLFADIVSSYMDGDAFQGPAWRRVYVGKSGTKSLEEEIGLGVSWRESGQYQY